MLVLSVTLGCNNILLMSSLCASFEGRTKIVDSFCKTASRVVFVQENKMTLEYRIACQWFILVATCRLEVHLSKTESTHWPELVPGDSRGTRVFTDGQLAEISDHLEKYTSDKVSV